ncbi:MAG: DUF1178 family protein [Alphaproteobacteria bacterium]
MIRYGLACDQGHRFDAWFGRSDDFDTQAATGLLSCPHCGSSEISKALMAPSVQTSGRRGKANSTPVPVSTDATKTDVTGQVSAGVDPGLAKAIELVRELGREIRKKSDDVGRRFPEEARKIHYGEVGPRAIVGEATAAEARELIEEGISFQPLPALPEKQN